MKKTLTAFILVSVMVIGGCSKASQPVNIVAWERYQDPYFKANFIYPKDWHVVSEGGKVSLFSSPDVMEKFFDPTSKNKIGLQLIVSYEKLETLKTLDDIVNSWKNDLASSGFTIGAVTQKTIDGSPAIQVEYSGRFDENTRLDAMRAYTITDSVLYYAHFGAFNELYAPNKFIYDSLLASIHLIRPKPAASPEEMTKPSATFTEFSNNYFTISHPDNFEANSLPPKTGTEYSLELKGYRQDCTIHIDVLPAKGLTVDKVVEQNAKFYKSTSRSSSTIDGAKVLFLNDIPAKDISRRVYFLVKNNKVYRMIFTYYQPKKNDYLPVFEKTIASVHVK